MTYFCRASREISQGGNERPEADGWRGDGLLELSGKWMMGGLDG